jgi:hypothetical protein
MIPGERSTMQSRSVREMSIEELRSRVEEAERILRVAHQLARHELRNPLSCERAKDRIASLCDDAHALFPGLGETEPDAALAQTGTPDSANTPGSTSPADSLDEPDVDYEKLRASLENPALMSQFPDGGAQFRLLAEQLLDSYDRHELYARLTQGFEQLDIITREGADAVRKQLAVALTLEGLRAKTLD